MTKIQRRIVILSLLVIAVWLIGVTGGSFYLLSYSLSPDPNRQDTDSMKSVLYSRYPYMEAWVDSMEANGCLRDTFVMMPSGERHHAMYIKGDSVDFTAVVIHGYKDNSVKYLHLVKMYNDLYRCNVLVPDLHAHGLSEGDEIGMGWNDRLDVEHWLSLLPSFFSVPADSMTAEVHGVSMGAATVMNLSGDSLPPYVRGLIEDCGYTSVWDEFATQLRDQFNLRPFPLLYSSSLLCKLRYGWSFGEASPLRQLSKAKLPLLFIHGDSDDFVPSTMLQPLFDVCPTPKQQFIGKGSIHAYSFHDHPAEYTKAVANFIGYIR